MRRILLALALIAPAGWAGEAAAPAPEPKPPAQVLCAACADKVFTADLGTCSVCKAHTASGAFTRCVPCAQKAGLCQACGGRVAQPAEPAK